MRKKKNMEIHVEIRNNYGQRAVYPVCQQAKLLAALSGNKTLTDWAIDLIKKMGYKIVVATPTP